MIDQLFTYLWQSAVVLTLLFIPFQLLLRKEQYFALNRAILLGILLLCLVLPFSSYAMPDFIEYWLHPEAEPVEVPTLNLGVAEIMDDMNILHHDPVIETPSWLESYGLELIMGLWLVGSVVFLLWQAKGFWQLYKILHDKDLVHEKMDDGNILLLSPTALPSFSWMHSIVISQEDYAENGETILTHERAHIAHHHSFDSLLLLVVQTIQWWNPFVWLMADALSQVHEYQADLAVLRQGINATQYQLLLIRKAAGPAGLALVNGFKRNKLKLRIVMMNNMIKLRGAQSRYLALLPMMLIAIACTATKPQESGPAKGDESKLTIYVNQKGELLFSDEITDEYVTLENLPAKLSMNNITEESTINIVADSLTSMSIITDLKNVLRENNVRKVVYKLYDK